MNIPEHDSHIPPDNGSSRGILVQILLISCVLLAGGAVSYHFLTTGPKPKQRVRKIHTPLVSVSPIHPTSRRIVIRAMGTVVSSETVTLASGVSGKIVDVARPLVPGTLFAKDEQILGIERIDYQLQVLERRQELAQAQNDLTLEMGNQRVAQREYELLGQEVNEEEKRLMLRQPQLEQKRLAVKNGEVRVARAELDLSRTGVKAPFNSILLEAMVGLGSRVSGTAPLVTLSRTDEVLVRLNIPQDKLRWLDFENPQTEQTGSRVEVRLPRQAGVRSGQLVRFAASVEPQGRMAQVYARIEDPLCLLQQNRTKGLPKLLIDSYVEAHLVGREVSGIFVVDRRYLRDNNTVWLLDRDNRLEIRPVHILSTTPQEILIDDGLTEGDRLITTSLVNATAGMQIREADAPGPRQKTGSSSHERLLPLEDAQ